jgi:hypothetical protein
MAIEGRGAEPAGPSAAVAELTTAAEPEPKPELEPAAQSRWVLPIGRYMRAVTSEFACVRYG